MSPLLVLLTRIGYLHHFGTKIAKIVRRCYCHVSGQSERDFSLCVLGIYDLTYIYTIYRHVSCYSYTVRYSHRRPFYGLGILCTYSTYIAMVVMYVTKHIAIVLTLSMYCKFRWKHFFVRKNLFEVYLTQCKKRNNQHENRYGPVSLGRQWGIFAYFIIRVYHTAITLRFLE